MDDVLVQTATMGREWLDPCVDSVMEEAAPGLRYHLRVIYNGEGAEEGAARLRERHPSIEVICRPRPIGYSAAHNLGLARLDARYIALIDDDTIIPQGTLAKMVAFMDSNPDVGLAGCRTVGQNGSFQPTWEELPTLANQLRGVWARDATARPELYERRDEQHDVPWLMGSFLFWRVEALEAVGPIDEHYFPYYFEADWALRTQRAGYRIVYLPDPQIVHVGGLHSVRSDVKKPEQLSQTYNGLFHYFRKHHGSVACHALRPIALATCASRILYYALVWALRPAQRPVASWRLRGYLGVARLCFRREPWMYREFSPGL